MLCDAGEHSAACAFVAPHTGGNDPVSLPYFPAACACTCIVGKADSSPRTTENAKQQVQNTATRVHTLLPGRSAAATGMLGKVMSGPHEPLPAVVGGVTTVPASSRLPHEAQGPRPAASFFAVRRTAFAVTGVAKSTVLGVPESGQVPVATGAPNVAPSALKAICKQRVQRRQLLPGAQAKAAGVASARASSRWLQLQRACQAAAMIASWN
jgi:hypothetical protein